MGVNRSQKDFQSLVNTYKLFVVVVVLAPKQHGGNQSGQEVVVLAEYDQLTSDSFETTGVLASSKPAAAGEGDDHPWHKMEMPLG